MNDRQEYRVARTDRWPAIATVWAASLLAVVATACRPTSEILPGDVRSYTLPKTEPAVTAGTSGPSTPALPLRYELPTGWVDAGASGMRLATVRTGGESADPGEVGEITVIPASGTLLGNATRWQEQLTPQADPARVAQAIAASEKVDVDGVEATIVLLHDDATAEQQAILAAVIPIEPNMSLFVKFKGAASLALRLRDPFKEFVRSMRWK